MKKLFYAFAIAAAAFTMAACGSSEKAEKAEASETEATQPTEEQTQAPAAEDIMAKAETVAKKIDAGQELTEDDYNIVLDYTIDLISFANDNKGNVEAMQEYAEKGKYGDKFDAAFDTWFEREDLKPETKAKIEKLTNLLQ